MAQLAIVGHATRGEEVIEILEMLGGSNEHNYRADCDSLCFYIGKSVNTIYWDWSHNCYEDENTLVLTLEEFIKEFPYKVGDKVSSKYLKNYKIEKMEWEDTSNNVIYKLQGMGWYNVDELKQYKEETMEKEISGAIVDRFICLEGYDFYDDKGNVIDTKEITMKKKQPKYPKTYKECCKVFGYSGNYNIILTTDVDNKLFNALYRLKVCRDAYWKIAGDWKPDWTKADERKYCIVNTEGDITKWVQKTTNKILAFPTEEMRDAFYENFNDLINECKELL